MLNNYFQVAGIQEAAAKNDDAVRTMRNEMSEYRKSVQTLNMEIDSLRGANDALNRGMGDLEDRYNRDCADYQETIANMTVSIFFWKLDKEFNIISFEMNRWKVFL